jgi:hypothetical protein
MEIDPEVDMHSDHLGALWICYWLERHNVASPNRRSTGMLVGLIFTTIIVDDQSQWLIPV